MNTIELNINSSKKIVQGKRELFLSDFTNSLRGHTPGEWSYFFNSKKNEKFIGYLNPHVENNRPCAYVIERIIEVQDIWAYIQNNLDKAIEKRFNLFNYGKNSRLIYGQEDLLPGLIVDSYDNCAFLQINTAGIDKYREQIQSYLKEKIKTEVYFLDNESYRKGEVLPTFDVIKREENISILENDLKYEIRNSVIQKVGYYYDHRINRDKAAQMTKFFNRKLTGLDLFCYVGSWGLNLLKANTSYVDFVDQGDFQIEVEKNLTLNAMKERGKFHRSDVFNYLKQTDKKYDVICSDPPAFCKSKKEANRAKDGYIKLHTLCLKNLNPKSLFIACSCTQYVGHEDFQQTVLEAAKRSGRGIQLIDIGMQSFDHPIKETNGKNSYLKYYAYYVE